MPVHEKLRQGRAVALLAAVGSLSLLAAGCGDDDGGDDLAKVQVEASGGKDGVTYSTSSTQTPSGATEIELVNSASTETDAQLVYTPEERSEEEVVAELRKAIDGQPVANWFKAGGGPGTTEPGASSTVTQNLQPGTYFVVGGDDAPKSPLATFEVGKDDGAELPEADAALTAVEYSFSADNLTAGANRVRLENDGAQWHHFLAAQLTRGSTIDDARRFLETEQGEPPFTEEGFESTVIEGDTSQITELDLEPGTYAVYCFISDKQGGPPHVAEGMVSEVTVEE